MTDNSQQKIDWLLIQQTKEGNQAAFEMLVKKYQHKIAGLVNRYVFDQDEAIDITQEVFVKAYKGLESFRGDSAFYTWIYRIAINTAKNYLVAKGRRPPNTDIDIDEASLSGSEQLQEVASPEAMLQKAQLQERVQKTLNSLPEELKVALSLREFEGLSYEDIAQIMQCPVGTVRSRIFRAREAIEKQIQPLLD